ncbi:MAG: hypothetical protein KBC06_01600 [Candidatus Pacebacteria bacterium]|nr:hypothetical protein [Candidatus Paceibacterota bacterium]
MIKSLKTGGISILGVIFLGVILILLLNYFHLSIKVERTDDITTSQSNALDNIWNKYFKQPVGYIWKEIVIKAFWQPFMEIMNRIGNSDWTANQKNYPELLPAGNSQ